MQLYLISAYCSQVQWEERCGRHHNNTQNAEVWNCLANSQSAVGLRRLFRRCCRCWPGLAFEVLSLSAVPQNLLLVDSHQLMSFLETRMASVRRPGRCQQALLSVREFCRQKFLRNVIEDNFWLVKESFLLHEYLQKFWKSGPSTLYRPATLAKHWLLTHTG